MSYYPNDLAERNIRTAEASMFAMLQDAVLRTEFWDEAVLTDVYLRKTNIRSFIDGIITCPEEARTANDMRNSSVTEKSKFWSHMLPKLSNLRHTLQNLVTLLVQEE